MKILHVISSLDPKDGGPGEGVRQIGLELHTRKLSEVEVVTLDAPGPQWLEQFPLKVHALGPALGHYRFSLRLNRWFKEHRQDYDAVIVNGLWQYGAFATRLALHGTNTPYFVFPHGMLDPWFRHHYPLKHLKKWLYWPWGDYRVLRDAAAVLFTCEEERILARQSFWLYRCTERVVNYGTCAPSGDPEKQRACFHLRFPALQDNRLLLFLSRIHEKKGCDLLIRAFAKVISNYSSNTGHQLSSAQTSRPLHLMIAGPCADEGLLQSLQQLSSDLCPPGSVSFPGMLTGDVKWGAFRSAEAFVLPSHQENFGIAVVEALACGTPVLISNKVNIWREVEACGGGMVEPDTLDGTAALLTRWLKTDSQAQEAMRINAGRGFSEHFEIAKAARTLLAAISEFLPVAAH